MSEEWFSKGEYLPVFLRDFHDQKDVFKLLWRQVERAKERDRANGVPDYLSGVTWVSAHIFVIDHFLWTMAKCGWTLQRSRKKGLDFADIAASIKSMRDEDAVAFQKMLDDRKKGTTDA